MKPITATIKFRNGLVVVPDEALSKTFKRDSKCIVTKTPIFTVDEIGSIRDQLHFYPGCDLSGAIKKALEALGMEVR